MAISYVVDVYRSDFAPTSMGMLATYLSFFPHRVAGPIVRPGELIPQFAAPRDPTLRRHVARVLPHRDRALDERCDREPPRGEHRRRGLRRPEPTLALGYTNIAIGIALLLELTFPQNFDAPYSATSITDPGGAGT
ncbi:MAG TPA: hypothetical protein VMK83_09780 [Gaiellaceae bacterium]|nr:hypothetical protein [Gaiellaceae bacterium]